jgi:hypothetical protein
LSNLCRPLQRNQAVNTKLAGLEAALAAARSEVRSQMDASDNWDRERKAIAEQLQVSFVFFVLCHLDSSRPHGVNASCRLCLWKKGALDLQKRQIGWFG